MFNWTQEDFNVFKIHHTKNRPYEYKNDVHIQVTFEFDLDLTVINRQVYSFLDWLGDTGGLGEALFIGGGFILWILNTAQLEALIVRNLYRIRSRTGKSELLPEYSDDKGELLGKVMSLRIFG